MIIDAFNNIGESQKYYNEQKMPDITTLETRIPRLKCWQVWFFLRSLSRTYRLLPSCCVFMCPFLCVHQFLVSSFLLLRTPVRLELGSTLTVSFNLITLNYILRFLWLGLEVEFGGDTVQLTESLPIGVSLFNLALLYAYTATELLIKCKSDHFLS